MSGLPDAVPQTPACGACGSNTEIGDYGYVCYDCQLEYDVDDLKASFLDPRAEVCGTPCDNNWHKDNAIRPGRGYRCGTCLLPSGHALGELVSLARMPGRVDRRSRDGGAVSKRVVNTDYVPYRNAAQAIREWAEGRPCGNPGHAQMLADWLHGLADDIKREAP